MTNLLAPAARLPPDAAHAHAAAQDAGVPIDTSTDGITEADLVIDALLGLGARSAPREHIAAGIDRINGSGLPVLAVDLPSGLPEYLRGKYPAGAFGALGLTAAAVACESMTGAPAQLSERDRARVADVLAGLNGTGA